MSASEESTKKLIIIGDGGCGKTSILSSFLFQTFSNEYEPTVFENLSHQYTYNGQPRVLKIIDTAGQEDYEALRKLSYPGTHLLIIAFDITRRESFDNVKDKWLQDKKKYMKDVTIFLVGTKYDLKDVKAQTKHISKAEGERMATKIKAVGYFETSSKPPPHGISELFEAIKKSANDPPKPPQPFCSFL